MMKNCTRCKHLNIYHITFSCLVCRLDKKAFDCDRFMNNLEYLEWCLEKKSEVKK